MTVMEHVYILRKEQQNKGLKEQPALITKNTISLAIVFRTLFPALKLRNVLFMLWPKGLTGERTV